MCYGLGWTLAHAAVTRCAPCDVYANNNEAAHAALETLAQMYTRLGPGEELVRGHGYEPFVLHPLPELTDACPGCDGALVSIEAGYDRYGSVTLEDKVLWVEDGGFSDDGGGPHYLYCTECARAYAVPDGALDYR